MTKNKYIAQDEAISILASNHIMGLPDWNVAFERAEEYIASIPAADVAPVVRGTKIPCTSVEDWAQWCRCSVCGYDELFVEDKFCSNCGAKMQN